MKRARTVLGDVEPTDLGSVDYHEHLFQVSPLLPGDDLDDEVRSAAEARLLRRSGFRTMLEATPTALGRRPGALARISADTGLHIIATTGVHRQAHYPDTEWLVDSSVEQLTARFVRDIQNAMSVADSASGADDATTPSGEPIRAGMLKTGVGYWAISAFERTALAAVSAAHAATNAPVMVHLEYGSAAHDVLDILEGDGVELSSVVLAHIDRNPDPGLHAELAARGAYLGYDGAARAKSWPDSTLIACLVEAARRGAERRIVIGGDVARASRYVSYGGLPGLGYLGERFLPRLRAAGGDELLARVVNENPQRLLARFETELVPSIS